MKSIKIYGASDDLIEIDGDCKGCEEYATGGEGPLMGKISLKSGDDYVVIFCIYAGSWAFAVCPQDGDCDRMPWDVFYSFGRDSAYSQTLEISVPDDCVVSFV
jgi:hypothetical protein